MNHYPFSCRFCLSEEGRSVNLFDEYVPSEKIFLNQLACLLFDVNIEKDDGITDRICLACFLKTFQILYFRKKCQNSEKTLNQKLRFTSNVQNNCAKENHVAHVNSFHERLENKTGKEKVASKPDAEKSPSIPSKEGVNIHKKAHTSKDSHHHLSLPEDTSGISRKQWSPSNQQMNDGSSDSHSSIQSQSQVVYVSQENMLPVETPSARISFPFKSQININTAPGNKWSGNEKFYDGNSEFLKHTEKVAHKSINNKMLKFEIVHKNSLSEVGGNLRKHSCGLVKDNSWQNSKLELHSNLEAEVGSQTSSTVAMDSDENAEKMPALILATDVNYSWHNGADVERTAEPDVAGIYEDSERAIERGDFKPLGFTPYDYISDPDENFEPSNSAVVIDEISTEKTKHNMDTHSDYHSAFIRYLNSNISDQDYFGEMMNGAYEATVQDLSIVSESSLEIDIFHNHQTVQNLCDIKNVTSAGINDGDNLLESPRCCRSSPKGNSEIDFEGRCREQIGVISDADKVPTSFKDAWKKDLIPSLSHSGRVSEYGSDTETELAFPLKDLGKDMPRFGKVEVNESSISHIKKDGSILPLINSKKNLSVQSSLMETNIMDHRKNTESEAFNNFQDGSQKTRELSTQNRIQLEKTPKLYVSQVNTNENTICTEIVSKIIPDTRTRTASIELITGRKKNEIISLHKKLDEESILSKPKNVDNSIRKRRCFESEESKNAKINVVNSLGESCKEATIDQTSKCRTCLKSFPSSGKLLSHVLQHFKDESPNNSQFSSIPKINQCHSKEEKASLEEEVEILWDSVKSKNQLAGGSVCSNKNAKTDDNETERNSFSRSTNVTTSQETAHSIKSSMETCLEKVNEDSPIVFIGKTFVGDNNQCKKENECVAKKNLKRNNRSSVNDECAKPLLNDDMQSENTLPVENGDLFITESVKDNFLTSQTLPGSGNNSIKSENETSRLYFNGETTGRLFCEESRSSLRSPKKSPVKHSMCKLKLRSLGEICPRKDEITFNSLEVSNDRHGKPFRDDVDLEIISANISCGKRRHSSGDDNLKKSQVEVKKDDCVERSSDVGSLMQGSYPQNINIKEITRDISDDDASKHQSHLGSSYINRHLILNHIPGKNSKSLLAIDGSKKSDSSSQIDTSKTLLSNESVNPLLLTDIISKSSTSLNHSVKTESNSKEGNNDSISKSFLKEKSANYDLKRNSHSRTVSLNVKETHSASLQNKASGCNTMNKEGTPHVIENDSFKLHKINSLNINVSSKIPSPNYRIPSIDISASNGSMNKYAKLSEGKCRKESSIFSQNENKASKQWIPNSYKDVNVVKSQFSNEKSVTKVADVPQNMKIAGKGKKRSKRRRKKKKMTMTPSKKNELSFSFPCFVCSQSFTSHGILLKHLLAHKKSTDGQQPSIHSKSSESILFGNMQKNDFPIRSEKYGPPFEKKSSHSKVVCGRSKSGVNCKNAALVKEADHSNETFENYHSKFRGKNIGIKLNTRKHNNPTVLNMSHSNKFDLDNNCLHTSYPPKEIEVSSVKKMNDPNLRYGAESSGQSSLCMKSNPVDSSGKSIEEELILLHSQNSAPKENFVPNEYLPLGKQTFSLVMEQNAEENVYECWICSKPFLSTKLLLQHSHSHFQSLQSPSLEPIRNSPDLTKIVPSQFNIPYTIGSSKKNVGWSSKFLSLHSSGDSFNRLEISQNQVVTSGFGETFQRGEVDSSKINEGRRMIQNKLAVNDCGALPGENKSFRCPACLTVYSNWSLITSHIVSCHNDLSDEWPMSLLFIPEIFKKLNEVSDNNLGSGQSEVDSSCQESFPCEFCDKLFVSNAALLKHKIWAHNASVESGP